MVEATADKELTILIHGMCGRLLTMRLIQHRLRRMKYDARQWRYPSFFLSIETVAQRLNRFLRTIEQDASIKQVNFVTHSMGGIITRAALVEQRFTKPYKVVMLAPPNRGSLTAAWLAKIVRQTMPSMGQLSNRPSSYVKTLAEPLDGKWAVIAATQDRVVSLESSRLKRDHDHHTIRTGHMRLLIRRDTAELVDRFFRTGSLSGATDGHASGGEVGHDDAADACRRIGA